MCVEEKVRLKEMDESRCRLGSQDLQGARTQTNPRLARCGGCVAMVGEGGCRIGDEKTRRREGEEQDEAQRCPYEVSGQKTQPGG